MEIVKYSAEHKDDCVLAFKSNLDQFFAASELDEFMAFLDTQALNSPYFVLMKEGQVIGCGGVSVYQGISYLCWGLVHRAHHHCGLGALLTEYRLDWIRSENLSDSVKIETSQHTQGFYARYGFVVTNMVHNGFGEGVDQVTMVLDLSSVHA
ncbi:GNAT family N-acetyltransferase [Photobacterium sp. R1]